MEFAEFFMALLVYKLSFFAPFLIFYMQTELFSFLYALFAQQWSAIPFANSYFQMRDIVMGFAEDFGNNWIC